MDRNQAKEFFSIMQAYAEGMVIECRTKPSAVEGTDVPNDWTEIKDISFWNNTEPTYRPFSNAEECWAEMQKHQPFGLSCALLVGALIFEGIRSLANSNEPAKKMSTSVFTEKGHDYLIVDTKHGVCVIHAESCPFRKKK